MNWRKEIVDQTAHFGYGLLFTLGASFFVPWYVAVVAVLGLGLIREWRQSPWKSFLCLFNYDVLFIVLGQAVAVVIKFNL